MSQATDYVIANDTHANVRADMNAVFAAVATMNSGSSAPGTTYAHMLWADTTGSPSIISIRNAANGAWNQLFTDTGLFRSEDGAAAAVAYGPNSDIDTGIHFSVAATTTIVTAGVHRAAFAAAEICFNDSGADTDVRFEAVSAPNAFFLQGSDGFWGNGTAAPAFAFHTVRDALNFVNMVSVAGTGVAAIYTGRRSRGTHASPTATSSGDVVLQISGQVYHTSGTPGYATMVDMRYLTDGAESGDTVPVAIAWRTTAAGGAITERMRITSAGIVGIGGAQAPTRGLLDVLGNSSGHGIYSEYSGTDTQAAAFYSYKARGTIASPSAVSSGDGVGAWYAYAYQNSAYQISGAAGFNISAAPSGSAAPSLWSISVANPSGTACIARVDGFSKALTNNTVTTLVSATIANNSGGSYYFNYSANGTDGTDFINEAGTVFVQILNKAGTVTTQVTKTATGASFRTGAAAVIAVAFAASAANPCVISVNVNVTGITPSAVRIDTSLNNHSIQAATLNI